MEDPSGSLPGGGFGGVADSLVVSLRDLEQKRGPDVSDSNRHTFPSLLSFPSAAAGIPGSRELLL